MKLTALTVMVALLAACGGGGVDSGSSSQSPGGEARDTTNRNVMTADSTAAVTDELVRGHLAAVENDNLDAYLSALSADTRFEIGGRDFVGRDAIRGFYENELSNGRYEVVDVRESAGGMTYDLTFRRGSLVEEVTYQYTVENGRIDSLTARYR